jgi:hypothetical protein
VTIQPGERTTECVVNPKTGKPFTRHNYEQTDLRVQSYVYSAWGGGLHPYTYSWTRTCKRCGREQRGTY